MGRDIEVDGVFVEELERHLVDDLCPGRRAWVAERVDVGASISA
jgi:hypothetical protein